MPAAVSRTSRGGSGAHRSAWGSIARNTRIRHPLDSLAAALAATEPRTSRRFPNARRAAVAAVLRPGPHGPELLFIRRPHRHGDRWSGDLAFPGGLAEDRDTDDAATARRECLEEVGLELGEPLAWLSPRLTAEPGRLRPMWMSAAVFAVPPGTEPMPRPHEVAEAFWFPWGRLARLPRQRIWRRVGGMPVSLPCRRLDGRLLWGLTHMLVEEMVRRAADYGP